MLSSLSPEQQWWLAMTVSAELLHQIVYRSDGEIPVSQ